MTDEAVPMRYGQKVMAAEGQNDKHVIEHILARSRPLLEVGVSEHGGLEELLKAI